MIIINPGTGPVADATAEQAFENMKAFVADVEKKYGITYTVQRMKVNPKDESDGRFGFEALGPQGREHEVWMPGIEMERVRYLGAPDQNIWDFPRLYVDGSSWAWMFAVNQFSPDKG